jgi:tRNA A-37 threonylcarbamoyl transferase component Bud32
MQPALGSGRLVAGRYRLNGPIGRGAMGIVWLGRDELLDRDVAIKQVQITSLASPAEAEIIYQRTLREARTAAKLNHPSVVTVFDVVEENGSPWIVMELVRARSLDRVITEDGPLPPLEAAQVGESLLSALTTAHAAGVLHRDVKPSNVLMASDGQAVLTDFGIATYEGDPGLTQVGMVVGTPGFTAPERIRGKQASPASDLWSLGATLYAAVEGRGPFDRPGGAVMIMDGVINEDAPRAPSAGPLGPVIDALLRSDPAARPDSAAAASLLADAASQAQTSLASQSAARQVRAAGDAGAAVSGGVVPAAASDDTTDARGAAAAAAGAGGGGGGGAGAAGGGGAAGVAGAAGVDGAAAAAARGAGAAGGAAPAGGAGAGGRGGAAAAAADVIPAFMEAPAFADLRMPEPESPDLPGQAGLPPSVELPAFMDAPRFADPPALPPDQAVPWSLANASANWDPHDPLSLPDSHGQLAGAVTGPPAARPGRRGRVLAAAAAAVLAVSAAVAWLVYSHNPGSSAQAQSLSQSPARAGASASQAQHSSGGRPGTGSKTAGPGATAGTTGKTPAAGATGKPGSTASPGPSPSPTASPSPGTGGPPPPAGYKWHEVSAASAGATAGFKIAVPAAWQMSADGLQTYFFPPKGSAYIEADLTPFAYAKPVREAEYLQAQAKADHTYHLYGLVAISSASFRGVPEGTWRFHWQEAVVGRIAVLQVLFTLTTSAGNQSYALTVSVPAANFPAIRAVFGEALQTFTPLP